MPAGGLFVRRMPSTESAMADRAKSKRKMSQLEPVTISLEGCHVKGTLGLGLDIHNLISDVEPGSVRRALHTKNRRCAALGSPSAPRGPSHVPSVQPAAANGVRVGDKLLSIDGHDIAGRRVRDVFAASIAAGEFPAARHELVLQRLSVSAEEHEQMEEMARVEWMKCHTPARARLLQPLASATPRRSCDSVPQSP